MWRRPPGLLLLLLALALAAPAAASAQTVEPKVIGGTQTTIDTYPWQAAVVYSQAQKPGKNAYQRQFCGGSLITSRIVITAAHCVFGTSPSTDPDCNILSCALSDPGGDNTVRIDPVDVSVVLGRTTLTNTSQGEEIPVQDVSYRPDFDEDAFTHDVAYLVLSAPSAQTQIRIAGDDESALWDPGSYVEVSGWGATIEGGNTVDTLRSATVQMISDSTCGDPDIYGSEFDPATMVCAGFLAGGVDTCAGDSGGPLEAPLEGGGDRLIGNTSWGDGCAEPNAPGVYSRVAEAAFRATIESDVAALEDANLIDPHESIVGSGGLPRSGFPPPPGDTGGGTLSGAGTDTATPRTVDRFAKCKRLRTIKKRKRCNRRVRATLVA